MAVFFEIVYSRIFSATCSTLPQPQRSQRGQQRTFMVLQMLYHVSDTRSKVAPAEILDRAPISTITAAALDSLLPADGQALISWHHSLSWPACGHQVAASRGSTGGRSSIRGEEAAPLCMFTCLSEAWAMRGPERPPMSGLGGSHACVACVYVTMCAPARSHRPTGLGKDSASDSF